MSRNASRRQADPLSSSASARSKAKSYSGSRYTLVPKAARLALEDQAQHLGIGRRSWAHLIRNYMVISEAAFEQGWRRKRKNSRVRTATIGEVWGVGERQARKILAKLKDLGLVIRKGWHFAVLDIKKVYGKSGRPSADSESPPAPTPLSAFENALRRAKRRKHYGPRRVRAAEFATRKALKVATKGGRSCDKPAGYFATLLRNLNEMEIDAHIRCEVIEQSAKNEFERRLALEEAEKQAQLDAQVKRWARFGRLPAELKAKLEAQALLRLPERLREAPKNAILREERERRLRPAILLILKEQEDGLAASRSPPLLA